MEMLFVLVYSILLIGTIVVPINNIKSDFLYRSIFGIIITFGINIIISIITYLLGLKCSIELLSVIYFFLLIPIIYIILKEKRIQLLDVSLQDIVFGILSGIVIIIIMMKQYGTPLRIKYETTDASTHFSAAISFMNDETLLLKDNSKLNEEFGFDRLMFGSYVNTGIFISIFSNFLPQMELYKLYIVFDMIILWLSILMFYIMLNSKTNLKRKIIIWIFSYIYFLSYPLNSVLMGSAYLTLSLLLVTTILVVFINKQEMKSSLFYLLLFVLNTALINTYMLFAIIVLISEIIYIGFKQKKIIPCIMILLPVLSILLYANNASEKLQIIQEEGPMYKNYYSNFIIFVPLIVTQFYKDIKNKEFFNIENVFLLVNIIILIVTYILKQKAVVSSYYCLKYYYILWIFTIFISGKMLLKLSNYRLALSILFTIVILITISISRLEYTYSGEELMEDITKESVFSIGDGFYNNINIILSKMYIMNEEELKVINKVKEMGIEEFRILGGEGQNKWIYAILNQYVDSNIYVEDIDDKYLICFKRATYIHQNIHKIKEKYEFIYENKYGGIMKKYE